MYTECNDHNKNSDPVQLLTRFTQLPRFYLAEEEVSPFPAISSVQFSHSVMSTLQPHWLQHTRLPCSSPTPRAYSNSCPLSRWYHPTISSSVVPFLLPSIFPSIRVFSTELAPCIWWPKYWSFSFSISPSNEYLGLISLQLTGLISLQSTELSRVSSNTTVQKHQFFGTQIFYSPTLTSIHDYWKNHSLD